ncbi:MAG: M60 family metallopeptidase [Oscillospiraceae bacterium]|nr:M60 family metallopeptidase [Oscillospiraceae bacterium]
MLYIAHSGNANNSQHYSVRVNGGTQVPILDLYGITDRNKRLEKAADYIEKLDAYAENIQKLHTKIHAGANNKFINKKFDEKNCIFDSTEILIDSMLFSLPATQMLAGLGNSDHAKTLVDSMDAMDEMMCLFYQHKGLNISNGYGKDRTPQQHLNIRYMRQFENSFMYAASNHIGIEWGFVSSLVNVKPNKDENGNYVNNGYFGWGIAHEIGHCLDQGTISMPEITNNYFAELAKGVETNADRRFNYTNIYNKVSSNQKGASSDVFTQFGLYWQLHLAYDKSTNHTTYSNYQEQLNNLFYAKLCYYFREPGRAPKPNGIALTLGDKDQTLMRLACAVTEKNVLKFLERWGKEPNKDTIAYAEQFEKETRAIFYANDDSRTYVREHAEEGSKLNTDATTEAISAVEAKINPDKKNEVNLIITPNGTVSADDILGYEIVRCTIAAGKTQEATIGFTQTNQFTDTITSLNNRTVSYKVIT